MGSQRGVWKVALLAQYWDMTWAPVLVVTPVVSLVMLMVETKGVPKAVSSGSDSDERMVGQMAAVTVV